MEKVTLSKAARKAFSEKIGRPVPDPNSEAFDELLEELRELQPDLYNDLYSALEYKSEPLPVEKEALRAHKRAQRQRLADHLKNRETHDGKQVTDKRKAIVVGGALATVLMGWIGYTNVSRGFTARAASVAGEHAAQASVADVDDSFGVQADTPELGEEFAMPEAVRVVQTVPPPPPTEPPQSAEQPEPEPAQAENPLPFGMGRPLGASQAEPEGGLPPVPSPPQPGVASAPPASPYLPPSSGVEAEPAVLPGNLSFSPLEATPEGPLNVLSSEGGQDTGLPGTPVGTLAANSANQSEPSEALPPPTSLGGGGSEEKAPAARTLGWEDPESQENMVEAKSLSFTLEGQQGGLAGSAAASPGASTHPLPPVPQVGGGVPPAPVTPEPAQAGAVTEPEVMDLSALLTPGTQLQAELVTGVAAAEGVAVPVIARTTGNWCGESSCADITWIGEASYPGTDRIDLTFTQVVVGNTAQSVVARAFGSDGLPGVQAGVRDAAPTAVQNLLRGAVGGAADYLAALNSRETVVISEDQIVRQPSEPDLGAYLLERGTELFSLPGDQTSIVRLAEIAPGTPFTVIYGL